MEHRTKIKHRERNRILNERWENDGLYNDSNQIVTISRKDNRDYYRGGGFTQGHVVRVPSIKRGKRTWRNFYRLFPRYKDIMLAAIRGERKAIIQGNYLTTEIPHHYNFSQTVKLRII